MLSRRLLRVKVVKAVYAHLQTESDNIPQTEKNLIISIDKAYDLYFHILSLLPELVNYAEARQEIARNKMLPTEEDLNPNRKFVENRAIERIASCEAINDYCAKRGMKWSENSDLIKNLYNILCLLHLQFLQIFLCLLLQIYSISFQIVPSLNYDFHIFCKDHAKQISVEKSKPEHGYSCYQRCANAAEQCFSCTVRLGSADVLRYESRHRLHI